MNTLVSVQAMIVYRRRIGITPHILNIVLIDSCDLHAPAVLIRIIIFINCNWVVTRWQWLFYMYTKYEIGY